MKAVVFGAGKIARGFLGQILHRSGHRLTFVESNADFATALDQAGRYYVNVMGNPLESEWIEGYKCLSFRDMRALSNALWDADIVFTSVIGKNLGELGALIAQAFMLRPLKEWQGVKTIVTCENWKEPSMVLRAAVLENLPSDEARDAFLDAFGITEAVVMRSAVEPTPEILAIDPLAVSVQDFWRLPIDATRYRGERIDVTGVEYLDDFQGFLQQKVYTYNAGNATIAYLGALRKKAILYEAANDPEIVEILHGVYDEINRAISTELHIPLEKQCAFSETAIRKYQDRNIMDFTERHARDPMRKLGPEDRIVGVARMIQRQGMEPRNIAVTLAAALYYESTNEADPTAAELLHMRRDEGVDAVLERVCGIRAEEPLAAYVHAHIEQLQKRGWIHGA